MKTKKFFWDKITGQVYVGAIPPNGYDRMEEVPVDKDCQSCKSRFLSKLGLAVEDKNQESEVKK